ncbi:MAG: hypothetical protein AB1411_06515 [Nitrospirota bacterium]
MPVNMDPKKRRKSAQGGQAGQKSGAGQPEAKRENLFEETEADREKALADAEWKNLWDATEVIDMDRW